MAKFLKGAPSPNPKGRPKAAEAASEIARGLVRKYALFDRLARIAAGEAVDRPAAVQMGSASVTEQPGPPTTTEQISAMKLLLGYAYGTPVQMTEGIEGLLGQGSGGSGITVTVNYVDKQIVQNFGEGLPVDAPTPAPGAAEGLERGEALQLTPGWPPVREIDAGAPPAGE